MSNNANVTFGPVNNPENFDIEERKMSEFIRRPDPLKIDGNLAENWRRFRRSFDIYLSAAELIDKSNVTKVNVLLNVIGDEAVEVFDTLQLNDLQRINYNAVITAFDTFCAPRKNTVYERFTFYQRKQKDSEPFDIY